MGGPFFQTDISHINIYLLFYKKPANGEEEEEEEDVSKLSERMDNSFYVRRRSPINFVPVISCHVMV